MSRSLASLSTCQSAPKYTLRGRNTDSKKIETPGPGNYSGNLEVVKYTNSPKFGFGGSRREFERPGSAPGPGSYSPTLLSKQMFGKSQGFGGAGRKVATPSSAESPGPGSYPLTPRVGNEGPKYSTGIRRDMPPASHSPGPAAYNPANDPGVHKMGRMPQHSFAKSARNGFRETVAPGPGQYEPGNVQLATAQQYSFGHSGRKEHKTGPVPGPGSYNTSERMGKDGPAYSAGSRSPRQTVSAETLTPGPGTYNGDVESIKYTASPKFGFGGGSKDSLSRPLLPGPGQYTPGILGKAAPGASFGTSTRAASSSPRLNVPGPGAYTLSPRLGNDGPKYSAGGKRDGMRGPGTPGPGTYGVGDGQVGSAPSSPRYGFGTGQRHSPRLSQSPGPGEYRDKQTQKGPYFSFSGRNAIRNDAGTPGPGAHEHHSLFA